MTALNYKVKINGLFSSEETPTVPGYQGQVYVTGTGGEGRGLYEQLREEYIRPAPTTQDLERALEELSRDLTSEGEAIHERSFRLHTSPEGQRLFEQAVQDNLNRMQAQDYTAAFDPYQPDRANGTSASMIMFDEAGMIPRINPNHPTGEWPDTYVEEGYINRSEFTGYSQSLESVRMDILDFSDDPINLRRREESTVDVMAPLQRAYNEELQRQQEITVAQLQNGDIDMITFLDRLSNETTEEDV